MSRYENVSKEHLVERLDHLEKRLREIATAPSEMERNARVEHALAEIENRATAAWASQFLEYVTSNCENYF